MSMKEFINKFLLGETFIHNIYGKVKVSSLPSTSGMVNVYSYEKLREVVVNIKDLISEYDVIKYKDENINEKTL